MTEGHDRPLRNTRERGQESGPQVQVGKGSGRVLGGDGAGEIVGRQRARAPGDWEGCLDGQLDYS